MRRPGAMPIRLADVCAGLVLVVLLAICFARLLAAPGALIADADRANVDHAQHDDFRPPGNDLTFLYLPHYAHVAAEFWQNGRLPRWDTRGFGGRPMVGNPQGGLFYPPVWLAWWIRDPAALGWLTIAHLLWAGLGVYVLVRDLGAGRPAATAAAGCLMLAPHSLAQVIEGHYPHVWAASWYPWAFLAYRRLRQGKFAAVFVLAPILALTLLTGHPQEGYYLAVALSIWVGVDAIAALATHRVGTAGRLAASWGLVLGLTLALAGVELLPDIAAQAWTLRGSRMELGKLNRYQIRALNLFQLLDPAALGGPADYFGHDNYWETMFSIGLVPLVLAAIGAAFHRDRRVARCWLAVAAGALVFAAGRKMGLFALLFEVMPGMNRFRVPARSLFLASLGASVLAGLGVESLTGRFLAADDWDRLWRWVRNGALAVVVGLLVLLPFSGRGKLEPVPRPDRALTLREIRTLLRIEPEGPPLSALAALRVVRDGTFWAALGGIVLFVAAARRQPERRPAWAVAFGMLGLAELAAHGHGLIVVAPAERFLGPDPISAAMARAAPAGVGPVRVRARDIVYTDLRAWSGGFEKINVNDSFQIQHAADLYEKLYLLFYRIPPPQPLLAMSEVAYEAHRRMRQGVLDRWSVAFLVSEYDENDPAWPLLARGTLAGSRYAVYRNPSALPRAYVVPRADATPEDVPAMLCGYRAVDPRTAVLMPADPLSGEGRRQPYTPARWCSNDPDRVVVAVTTEAPGLLVVADTWMPGWTATVDGRPAPIYRGNHAQRVVPLDRPGAHQVELRYQAPGLARGVAISAGSVFACLVGFVATRSLARRRVPDRPVGPPFKPSHAASAATIPASGSR